MGENQQSEPHTFIHRTCFPEILDPPLVYWHTWRNTQRSLTFMQRMLNHGSFSFSQLSELFASLEILHAFCRLLFFFKITFFRKVL